MTMNEMKAKRYSSCKEENIEKIDTIEPSKPTVKFKKRRGNELYKREKPRTEPENAEPKTEPEMNEVHPPGSVMPRRRLLDYVRDWERSQTQKS